MIFTSPASYLLNLGKFVIGGDADEARRVTTAGDDIVRTHVGRDAAELAEFAHGEGLAVIGAGLVAVEHRNLLSVWLGCIFSHNRDQRDQNRRRQPRRHRRQNSTLGAVF